MARITVQRQCWQRWPRVLIAEKHNDDGTVDERRYVPVGGTAHELETALRRASKFAADMSGSCPLDMFDFRAKDCDRECDDSYAECWRRYFEREEE